jgi:uncharacterized protein with von Willebrand factor type A (vWA) domain
VSTPGADQSFNHWIESDTFDFNAFEALKDDSPSLQALEESGSKLLPHFDGFLLDLFALLFKMNVVLHPAGLVAPSAGFYKLLLDRMLESPGLEGIRRQTILDEPAAGLATLLLGEALLELLKSERIVTRGEMLDLWNLQQQEEDIRGRTEQGSTAEDLREQVAGRSVERQLDELGKRLGRENEAARRRLDQQARRINGELADGVGKQGQRIDAQVERALHDLEGAREEADRWSLQLGGGFRSSRTAQIELGHRLARNPKLKRMAQLVGRMRESARALRQKLYERANAEMYEVGIGDEISRLLPPELLSLRHPVLRRDFCRRLLDGELLVYRLRAKEQKGRGPLIVCLDGSSSMAGDKEIWSKAVTLTLLDIATRQRRRFRSICFSSPETPLQVLDLNPRRQQVTDMQQVFELAEYFPGGGTDFQKPLTAALECLRGAPHKRGDIVFITDGECGVDANWLREFKAEKAKLGFSLFSVLIDVGPSSLGPLKDFSDQITSVSQLTSEATRDIFIKL